MIFESCTKKILFLDSGKEMTSFFGWPDRPMYLCRWKWMNIRGEGGKLKKPDGFQKQRHGLDSFLPSPSSSSFFPHHAPRINYGMTMGKILLRRLAGQL